MVPWLVAYAVFLIFRFLANLFFCIVNDMIFGYNIFMGLWWTLVIIFSVYGWLLVYSLYIELSDLTKLEDLAHLRVRLFFYILRRQILNVCFVNALRCWIDKWVSVRFKTIAWM